MSDKYSAGKCPKCGEFAVGTYRHFNAPVFCINKHEWKRPAIEDLQTQLAEKEKEIERLRNIVKETQGYMSESSYDYIYRRLVEVEG